MNIIIKLFYILLLLSILVGCQRDVPNSPALSSQKELDSTFGQDNMEQLPLESGNSPVLLEELVRARQATAKFHNMDILEKEGYSDINLFIAGMGNHYLNNSLVDDKFEIEKPEALVYHPWGSNNTQKLVAVEYIAPIALFPQTPPEGFTGNQDQWSKNLEKGVWTLHVWVWMHNPDGIFAELNPRLVP
jgi:hypothetical protein